MMYITPEDRNQYSLISNSLDDLVSPTNAVGIIDLLVDKIVFNNIERFEENRSSDVGRPKYHPSVFLKLYLYGYLNGISSSRKLEKETHRNIEVIWLLGKLEPDHWVISNYRKENEKSIKYVTREFRRFLRENKYIKNKIISIDGTKIKANAKKEMLTVEKINKRLSNLEEELEKYLEGLRKNDLLEDSSEEIVEESISNQPNINRALLEKISDLEKKILELEESKKLLEESGKNKINPTDKDASLLKSRDGYIPGYNVQSVVYSANKMIVSAEVVTDKNDIEQLSPVLESIIEEYGETPEEIIADKGYYNTNLKKAIEENKGTKCYVGVQTNLRDKEEIEFIYNEEKDEFTCTAGKSLKLKVKGKKKRNSFYDVYQGTECSECPLRAKCTKSKKGRLYHKHQNSDWIEEYKKRMKSSESKLKLSQRKGMVEHPFGTLKLWMGKIPLWLRGIKKVTSEINIYVTAYNLRRLISISSYEEIITRIGNYNWAKAA